MPKLNIKNFPNIHKMLINNEHRLYVKHILNRFQSEIFLKKPVVGSINLSGRPRHTSFFFNNPKENDRLFSASITHAARLFYPNKFTQNVIRNEQKIIFNNTCLNNLNKKLILYDEYTKSFKTLPMPKPRPSYIAPTLVSQECFREDKDFNILFECGLANQYEIQKVYNQFILDYFLIISLKKIYDSTNFDLIPFQTWETTTIEHLKNLKDEEIAFNLLIAEQYAERFQLDVNTACELAILSQEEGSDSLLQLLIKGNEGLDHLKYELNDDNIIL